MINKEKILRELEEILNANIDPVLFPYKKGNSIRIGKFVVRSSKGLHKLFDCEENAMVAETFSKTAALALAKTLSRGAFKTDSILDLDKNIQKWYNDCVFYNHTLKKTTDCIKQDVISVRYDIARQNVDNAKRELDKYIYRNS